MAAVRVNVAVLSVADPSAKGAVAIENVVADRLTAAGHQISAFEAVRDGETAIHSQLVGFVADPDVDVVIVIGDGAHTGAALRPLVEQSLPGFADLLRMLAQQEVGASAAPITAEAVRCGTTFVFVVPGSENAVKAAMEKLILPQLDPNTKPRNLIASMPRLRDAVSHDVTRVDVAKLGEVGPSDVTRVDTKKIETARVESAKAETNNSVPTPIKPEKTATGAGVKPKLPAGTAPVAKLADEAARPRSRTGKNIVARKDYDPTKEIDLEKLQAQIELSKEEEATKAQIAAPSKPATIAPAARANVATRPLDVGNLRAPATPTGNAPVVATKAPVATKPLTPPAADEASFADIGDATKPLDLTKPTTPVTAEAIATAKPATTRPARAKSADIGEATKPMDLNRLPKLPPGANKDALDGETEQIIAPPPKAKPAATVVEPAPVARIQLEKRAVVASTPLPSVTKPFSTPVAATPTADAKPTATPVTGTPKASTPTPVAAATATAEVPRRVRQPTPPPPLPGTVLPIAARPVAPRVEEPETVETLDIEPDAEVPVPAAAEAAIDDDPVVASSSLLATPVPTRRKPTEPPPTLSELINASPSNSLAELPQGSFHYPTKRSSKLPLVLGLLLLSAIIGGGAMFLLKKPADEPPAEDKPVAQPVVEIDAAVIAAVEIDAPVIAAVEVDAAEPDPIEVEPPDAAVEEPKPANTKPANTKPANTKPANTKPANTKPANTKPANTKLAVNDPPPEKPPEKEKPAGPVAEPGCEEVTCVLEKYARPCCERFKPKGGTFDPGAAENLSKTQIKAGVDKMRSRVLACAEQHKDAKGTVKLSIAVDGEGNVSELSVQMAPDDGLGECVASAMRKAKFAKTANGGSFSYPFVF